VTNVQPFNVGEKKHTISFCTMYVLACDRQGKSIFINLVTIQDLLLHAT